jgi:taurine dioxygenase
MTLTVNTLTISTRGERPFAAEVTGVDFTRAIGDGLAAELHAVVRDHPVVVMRTAGLTAPQFLALAQLFGEPQVQLLADYRLSEDPAISIIASEPADRRTTVFGGYWHTDDSYLAVPAKATMLYAHVIPSSGGDTLYADMTAAYETLDDATRARLENARAVHTYLSRRNRSPVPTRTAEEQAESPPVVHAVVRPDRGTGRRSLYLNPNRMDGIVGLDDAASDALLDRLIDHATQDRFVYRHVWQPHDVVMWDNGRTMHRATADYGERREMLRILLKG